MATEQEWIIGAIRPRLRVRIFLALSTRWDWLPQTLRAAHMAIWLGILDEDDLNVVTAGSYDVSSDFGSQSHNLRGFFTEEEKVVRKLFPGTQSLLVAAAGGGREAIALAREGYEVTAFDSSEALTIACRANIIKAGVKATILDASPDSVPKGLGLYDGLLVGRGAYHHIPGRRRRIRFLKKCWAHLTHDAPVFLDDFFVLPVDSKGFEKTRRIARVVRWIRRSQEPIEIGDQLNSENFYHRFQRHEIEAELHEAGFRVELIAPTPWRDDPNLAHAVARST